MNFIEIIEVFLAILLFITLSCSLVMLIKVKDKKKFKIFFGFVAEIFFISLFTIFLKTELVRTIVFNVGLFGCSIYTIFEIKKLFDSVKNKNNATNSTAPVVSVPIEPNLVAPYNGTPYYNETPYPIPPAPVKTKKSFPILVVIPIVFVIAFVIVMLVQSNKMIEAYKDTNGPTNYELNTITEDDFLVPSFFSSTFNSIITNVGNTTTYSVKKLYGIKLIYETKSDDDTVVLDIKSKVTSGNCKIAVLVDKKIHKILEANTSDTITIKNANNKSIEVAVAGEEACVELEVTRKY